MFRKLAPALVAPLLLLSACASEAQQGAVEVQTGAGALTALRATPDAVAAAGTAAFEMQLTISADQSYDITATGAVDADHQRMSMQMDMGDLLAGLAASSGESIPAGFDEPIRFVIDGTDFYLRIPMLDSLTGSSGWLSVSPGDLGKGGSGSLGLGAGGYDPSQMLEMLRGVADDVTADGQEQVRGVPTTKYTATISLDQALSQAPADQRERLQTQIDQLGAGDASVPVQVWIDADGLPRRVVMAFDGLLGAADLGGGGSMEMRMELFDYGKAITIDVPSADEVTPFSDVLGGLGGVLGGAGS